MSQLDLPPSEPVAFRIFLARRLDQALARPMFFLALLFLVIAAGVMHRVGTGPEEATDLEENVIVWALFLLWPFFLLDALVRFYVRAGRESFRRRFLLGLLQCLLPPVRLAGRSYEDPERLWLPRLGWRHVDKELERTLERVFSVPMIIIALLVLPFLALEFFWEEQVRSHFGLDLFLDIGTSLIWMAFVLEFTVMASVAPKKLRYGMQNWMDLAVVVLPMVDFLPILRLLRLTRLLQLQQLSRLGRVYRLRGLLFKLWRALLLLELVQRLLGHTKERRLNRLQELLAAKEEELAELRREIGELEDQLAQENRRAPRASEGNSAATSNPSSGDPVAETPSEK